MASEAMSQAAIARISKRLPLLLVTGEADPASNMAERVRMLEQRLRSGGLSRRALREWCRPVVNVRPAGPAPPSGLGLH